MPVGPPPVVPAHPPPVMPPPQGPQYAPPPWQGQVPAVPPQGYPPQGQQASPPPPAALTLPNLNDPAYKSGTPIDYLPWVSGPAGTSTEELCLVKLVSQGADRNSKNRVAYSLEVLETSRPHEVRVGKTYSVSTNLDVAGSFEASGTAAYFAGIELAMFSAATLGQSTEEAQAAGINLNQHLNHMIAQGEEVAKLGIRIRVNSKNKHLKDKVTGQLKYKQDGSPNIITNRFYDPAGDHPPIVAQPPAAPVQAAQIPVAPPVPPQPQQVPPGMNFAQPMVPPVHAPQFAPAPVAAPVQGPPPGWPAHIAWPPQG